MLKGAEAVTKEDAKFDLGSATSELTFQNGVRLSDRTSINVNTGNLISGANLIMEDDTSLQINGGLITVAGDLIATNTNSEILTSAFATASTGTVHLATVGGNVAINNDTLKIDLGWLAKTNNINTTGGIWVNWEYNSVSNSIEGLTPEIAAFLDANLITNTSFAALNAGGKVPVEYAVSQMPDASETALNTAQQVNRQIAARGTEFRSMNGYASSKPRFGNAQPTGVAGPDGEKEKTMQGWIRAYGSKGDMDATANFSAYDSTSWGSVIGIDKTFGKLLVGIAGGFSRSDLDATAYDADIETYHGTAYSTFGGENIFIDLALTYGVSEIEESNVALGTTSFDADLISFYIGGGYSFNVKDKISLTPEASLLTTAYSQDAYERTVLGNTAVVQAYDATSYVGSLGVNVATIHQIDWLNQGIAMIPEIRLHYMHDFDADPDDFKYTLGGNTGAFAVRPRDEDMIRFGAGFDMWSWKRQNSKFEIDYDGLFSENYSEHILSGKITFKF